MKPKVYYRDGKLGRETYVKNPNGYTAFFENFPHILSEGSTIKEAQSNLWKTIYDTLKYFIHDR